MTSQAGAAGLRRSPREHARLLGKRYDRAAEAYDRYWRPVILPVARPVLTGLALGPRRRFLDLATGTGGLLEDLAASGAQVAGADRSLGMLRVARRRHRAPLVCLDAHRIALRDGSFDAVTAAFVLFHLSDPEGALREIRRVLRPGGVAAIVIWGEEPACAANELWLEQLARLPEAPGEVEFDDTGALMDSPSRLRRLPRAAGFDSPRCWSRRFAHRRNREWHFEYRLRFGHRWRRQGNVADPARGELIETLRRQASELPDSAFVYRPQVVYGTARRP